MPDPMSPSQAPYTASAILTAPLHVGGGEAVPWAGQVPPGSHSPQGAEAQSRAFCPRARAGPPPHTAQDTQSRALMRRWWTLMATHPAAHSSLHSQSPGFVLRQQAQVWWASPVVKPLLAPQPLLQTLFQGWECGPDLATEV